MFKKVDENFRSYMLEILHLLGYRLFFRSKGLKLKVPKDTFKKGVVVSSRKTNLWFSIDSSHIPYLRLLAVGKYDKDTVRDMLINFLAQSDAKRVLGIRKLGL